MQDTLDRFHQNKQIFIDLDICGHFDNIPKLHFLEHYLDTIILYGTTDNYNTEYTERLHIYLAKDAYHATNHKDEFSQMTIWLERKEKIYHHEKYIAWQLVGAPPPTQWHPPAVLKHAHLQMMKHPSRNAISLDHIVRDYGASYF